jgi:nicotinamidase-related amidase
MAPITLDPATTALVVIDLQNGITSGQTFPHSPAEVIERAVRLAKRVRERRGLVVLVRVDTGPAGELFPRPITDIERPRLPTAPDWSTIVPALGPAPGDVVVTKHQPSAFFGTDLEIHLRRRGIHTIVLCGISTNVGVEATARTGFEHGFNLVFASDAMAARDGELHAVSVGKFFPTIGRVRTTAELVAGLD